MKIGEQIKFDYTGDVQEVILPAGQYKFECWGAESGLGDLGTGTSKMLSGKGGYSKGVVTLLEKTMLYIYIGGKGNKITTYTAQGGWNGGGGCNSDNGATGGGASDIRLFSGNWDLAEGLYSRIIVAGGGGGSGWNNSTTPTQYGGSGGGIEGISGSEKFGGYRAVGLGGTQLGGGKYDGDVSGANSHPTEGSFGIGGRGSGYYSGGGGGGAGWYGGGGGLISPGGGGSGYVLTETSYKPENYTPTSEYYFLEEILIDGDSEMPSPTGGTQIGQVGNGYCIITFIGKAFNARCKINGQIKQVNDMKVKVNGTWKDVTKTLTKINGIWK